jgi:hypothetical protein
MTFCLSPPFYQSACERKMSMTNSLIIYLRSVSVIESNNARYCGLLLFFCAVDSTTYVNKTYLCLRIQTTLQSDMIPPRINLCNTASIHPVFAIVENIVFMIRYLNSTVFLFKLVDIRYCLFRTRTRQTTRFSACNAWS